MAISAPAQRRIVLLFAAACLACAPAPRMGEAVDIAEESAIIIWDAAAKTQHFIRRASFRTQAKDFGFLVPTPSVPELKEADDAAFALLERITEPPVLHSAREARKSAPAPAAAVLSKVEVVAKAKVAGYDAAVLRASDAGALDQWLRSNEYHSSPELQEWFKPYLSKGWLITAFKIAGEGSGRADASSVRMSFRTEAPFFPYREPTAAKGSADPRLLRIFYLGQARPEGRIGAAGPWPGRTLWSGRIEDEHRRQLLAMLNLPEGTAAGATRLTRFADGSSPRPGTDDLYLSTSADQSLVPDPEELRKLQAAILEAAELERRMRWAGPAAFLLLAVAIVFIYFRLRSRKRPTSETHPPQ
jgi:hypothetical protein